MRSFCRASHPAAPRDRPLRRSPTCGRFFLRAKLRRAGPDVSKLPELQKTPRPFRGRRVWGCLPLRSVTARALLWQQELG